MYLIRYGSTNTIGGTYCEINPVNRQEFSNKRMATDRAKFGVNKLAE